MTDSNVQIRLAGPQDKDTVTRVFHDAGLDTEEALAPGTTYWVLERGGHPVGAIGLEHGEGASLLRGAAILPEARGHGLGRRLVMSAVEYAQGRGDRAIYMFSNGGDWANFGFQQVPLAVVMGELPDAPQIQAYRARSERPGGTTWMRPLDQKVSQA
ncbi:N-acetyltransferase [Deinococcus metallilatus]|uniref:GNAT family N-acetyltransferase n=2 Tax=Deinococcus TaxID=1298 RepID=A0AAJ5F1A3_9DEIO|nr:GNAT family N-acetyltransferase [Deinococcus metallilatus]MBB5296187.1 N-acetylglutamate synthase-like GNAT family acetyltransferase [Deinococcus metallilatus]QBY09765.1 N-acetyltransferase [Deinococcus metallilatus]RXJ08963.1 N-acetyltransferase [Deinococcus metallilatus]TLK23658.1 GNAT family N-acetyltransferase [Deinococcus metallilatus]GMA14053.1 GNAT family N-acetyltransferase [Deinococcus metallilatus]